MGRYDIHRLMRDHQMMAANELLDKALAFEAIGGHLMADSYLDKACDLELIVLGHMPRYHTKFTTFDSYYEREVSWLPMVPRYPSLPPPREKPIAYVANTLSRQSKSKRSDYISFGSL